MNRYRFQYEAYKRDSAILNHHPRYVQCNHKVSVIYDTFSYLHFDFFMQMYITFLCVFLLLGKTRCPTIKTVHYWASCQPAMERTEFDVNLLNSECVLQDFSHASSLL